MAITDRQVIWVFLSLGEFGGFRVGLRRPIFNKKMFPHVHSTATEAVETNFGKYIFRKLGFERGVDGQGRPRRVMLGDDPLQFNILALCSLSNTDESNLMQEALQAFLEQNSYGIIKGKLGVIT